MSGRNTMRAMILSRTVSLEETDRPLREVEMAVPEPGPGEILVEVAACGVCHTELDEIEGRTTPPRFPVIPGHEIVGRVASRGAGASRHGEGDRVGVGWIQIKSVANITGRDIAEFLPVAGEIPLKPEVRTFPLERANEALLELKRGPVRGAKVLEIR
ncbi:MAG: alcohol dehydrogenase catalytic domain-containing protein [Verrucomicrobiales bacterium]